MSGKNKLTLGSLFDGSGGFPLAAQMAGITPIWASEIEPFPIKVTKKRFPEMKHYGDVSKINGAEVEPVDIITFGSPCFPKGTLILTENGYKNIEDVSIGEKVLTHKGLWKKVTATGSKEAPTIILRGNHYGLECTSNHPIYSAESKKSYENGIGRVRLGTEREWIPAGNMLGKLWAVPNNIDALPISKPHYENSRQKAMPELSESLFYLVGRWLGDGWLRTGQRTHRPFGQKWGQVLICDSLSKEEELRLAIEAVTDKYSVERSKGIVKFKLCGQVFCNWLKENFGQYSYGKELPSWVYGMNSDWRAALLKGICDSDGYKQGENMWKISTVSQKLAEGIRILGEIAGYSTTIHLTRCKPKAQIQGRVVSQRDYYTVVLTKPKLRQQLRDPLHGWYRVKSVQETGVIKTVYNLTVEDDNSYVANGIVVHNCQDISVAGQRAGLEGNRSSLFFQAIRIIKEMREATNGTKPRYIVFENVYGIFSSNDGEDLRTVLEEICKVKDPNFIVPRCEKWQDAGSILADDFSVTYRVLDAQYWGVPQRRKRIFIVADFRGGGGQAILFNSECLSGYLETSKRTWQRPSRNSCESVGTSSNTPVRENFRGGVQR